VTLGALWLTWHFHGVVKHYHYESIPAWRNTIVWSWVAVLASTVVTTLIYLLKDWRLALVLIPASLVLGLASAFAGLSIFACHGCGDTIGVVLVGSTIYGSIAIFTFYVGIKQITKARRANA
jgi:hypothetical protein